MNAKLISDNWFVTHAGTVVVVRECVVEIDGDDWKFRGKASTPQEAWKKALKHKVWQTTEGPNRLQLRGN